MKTIRFLIIPLMVAALLSSCGGQSEQTQQTQQVEQTEFQSLKDKLGIINSLDKEAKTFDFVMLPEKHGDSPKTLPIEFMNPIIESETIKNATVESLQDEQSIRLSAVSNGTSYQATKIVILGNPQKNELKLDPNAKKLPQKPKNP